VFIKQQQCLSALKIQTHYAGGRDPETSTTARELWSLCKLNQIDPVGIDLLGLSYSDMGEKSSMIIRTLIQRANFCGRPYSKSLRVYVCFLGQSEATNLPVNDKT